MKTRKMWVVMLVVIGFAGASAMAANTEKKCEGKQGKGPCKAAIMKRFDKDGDGKLSDTEKATMKAARQQKALERFDKDGNGKLSDAEKAAMEQARARHQIMLKKFDKDNDGKLSDTEKAEMKAFREARRQEMLKKWDKDGDGKLSDAERAEAKKARLSAKAGENAKPEGKNRKHDKNSEND